MRLRKLWVGAAATALLIALSGGSAHAASGVSVSARIGGNSLSAATNSNALKLQPGARPIVSVHVTNNTSKAISIRSIRIEGKVMGLAFFSYQTGLTTRIGSNDDRTIKYRLDLIGLDGQAVGLIPASLAVLDQNNDTIASQSFTSDVKGSLLSVYGIFGIAVLAFTALTLAAGLFALARYKLPKSRIRRALWFTAPGIGAGLTLTFALSALGLVAPRPALWVPLVLGGGIVGFVLGYLTPAPESDDEEDEDDDDLEALDIDDEAPVTATATTVPTPATTAPTTPATATTTEPSP
jgi:hypothetical protein